MCSSAIRLCLQLTSITMWQSQGQASGIKVRSDGGLGPSQLPGETSRPCSDPWGAGCRQAHPGLGEGGSGGTCRAFSTPWVWQEAALGRKASCLEGPRWGDPQMTERLQGGRMDEVESKQAMPMWVP